MCVLGVFLLFSSLQAHPASLVLSQSEIVPALHIRRKPLLSLPGRAAQPGHAGAVGNSNCPFNLAKRPMHGAQGEERGPVYGMAGGSNIRIAQHGRGRPLAPLPRGDRHRYLSPDKRADRYAHCQPVSRTNLYIRGLAINCTDDDLVGLCCQ